MGKHFKNNNNNSNNNKKTKAKTKKTIDEKGKKNLQSLHIINLQVKSYQ